MRLGLVKLPNGRSSDDNLTVVFDQLRLADTLGLHLAYLSMISPLHLSGFQPSKGMNLGIGLDAASFGALAPRKMEAAVRDVNDHLKGRLYLGVEMCGEGGSRQSRTAAQNYETLFSAHTKFDKAPRRTGFPMTPPCPKIVGLPGLGAPQETALAAARGYLPLTPSWLPARDVARHWPALVEGATSALRRARPLHWNLARMIVVHDDPALINAYVFDPNSPIRSYYVQLAKRGLLASDLDDHLARSVIAGSAEKVADDILALQETVGEIGTLHMIDPPKGDPKMTRTTMMHMAEKVVPLVNRSEARSRKELERT